MNDTQAAHDRLWSLIEAAKAETDHQAANGMFREAEKIATSLHQIEPENADHCYAIALTYYHRWGSRNEHRECLEWLKKTEELDPTHPWVPLYLGHQYFDDNRFHEAYVELNRVNQDYFASIDQHWRNLKIDELKIVSLIHSGSESVEYALLVCLIDRFSQADTVDRPVPVEIIKALAVPINRERFTAPAKYVAAEACRLIRACDDANVFPDELAAFDAAKSIG